MFEEGEAGRRSTDIKSLCPATEKIPLRYIQLSRGIERRIKGFL
jgi:hypothetical protein